MIAPGETCQRTGLLEGAKYLSRGLEDGAERIKDYLRRKDRQYNKAGSGKTVPSGVRDRMTYLGW